MDQEDHGRWLMRAVELSREGMRAGAGGPFGCVVVRGGEFVAEGHNEVFATNDPTAHAEVVAIRRACAALASNQLTGCIVYASCEPCPMCLGAIYWARPVAVYFANTHRQAAAIGFDDEFIYREIDLPPAGRAIPFVHRSLPEAVGPFDEWAARKDGTRY